MLLKIKRRLSLLRMTEISSDDSDRKNSDDEINVRIFKKVSEIF